MKNPVILFRDSFCEENELQVCQYYFNTYRGRCEIPSNSLVIGRYSVLPYYKELEFDLAHKNSQLINSSTEHLYIADLKNWYPDLKSSTFRTWFNLQEFLDSDYNGPVVLKGMTNSKKHLWSSHMFAANKDEALEVYLKLQEDMLISNQEIYIREYCQLKTYIKNPINEMPITEEFRVFFYKGTCIAGGYYWSEHYDFLVEQGVNPNENLENAIEYAHSLAQIVKEKTNFFVLDIGVCSDGSFKLIEVNDGQMSGLSMIEPTRLYKRLRELTNFQD